MTALLVIAKAPVAGRAKTRLCPPCTAQEAARLAEAALADTLDTVAATPCTRRVVVLDGPVGPWLPDGFDVVPQVDGGLDARLAGAFAAVDEPALLVGMDTPQVSPADLTVALESLERADAVLGPADDGGWWAVGLQRSDPDLFLGVPMSEPDTGIRQLDRLRARGLDPTLLPSHRDVDTFDDALVVAGLAPGSAFAAAVSSLNGADR